MNKNLMEKERSMICGVGMAEKFWAEVVDMACYPMNRSLSTTLINKTPYETWADKKPSLAHVKDLWCQTFVHVPKEKKSKLIESMGNASSSSTRME